MPVPHSGVETRTSLDIQGAILGHLATLRELIGTPLTCNLKSTGAVSQVGRAECHADSILNNV